MVAQSLATPTKRLPGRLRYMQRGHDDEMSELRTPARGMLPIADVTAPAKRDGRSKKRPGVDVQRERIVDAAVSLFIEQGSRAVSISRICQEADVSRPTFYRCFDDKEALIHWMYQYAVDDPVGDVLASLMADPNATSPEQARPTVDRVLDTIFERSKFAQLIFVESRDPLSPAFAIIDDAYERAVDLLVAWAKSNGAAAPSRVLFKSMLVACQWVVHDAIRKGLDDASRAAAKDAAWDLTLGVLGRTLRSAT